jgi:hypothetical protein
MIEKSILDGRRSRLFDIQSKYARNELGHSFPANCSVLASSAVVKCLAIKRLDFSRIASLEMMRDLQLSAGDSYHTVESLQENYKKDKVWSTFKIKTMGELGRSKMYRKD